MKLIENIKNAEYYIKEFAEWEASEQIIGSNKSIWCLKKKGSTYQKVCLYVDGHFMVVYGDYGTMTFSQMTWWGNVYNLRYDNIECQIETLSPESREALNKFDESTCRKDVFNWFKKVLKDKCNIETIEKAFLFLKNESYLTSSDIREFCKDNNCNKLKGIMEFTRECLDHTDEHEWISFLRTADFEEYDSEGDLWNAGKEIDQRYYINMYALQVCAEKLMIEWRSKN